MFSRRKPEPAKRRNHDLSQFGLVDIPDDFDPADGIGGNDDDDADLEAELAAIAGGGRGRAKPKPKPKILPSSELDRMIADSLRDVGSDNESLSGDDENDPDLLGELQEIAGGELVSEDAAATTTEASEPTVAVEEPPQLFLPTTTVDTISVIKERIEMYKQAESAAKAAGEAAKARRFNRGLKTLADLLKHATAGKQINVDDIPPVVSVKPVVTPNADGLVEEKSVTPPIAPTRIAPAVPDEAPVPSEENTPPPPPQSNVEQSTSVQDQTAGADKNTIIEKLRTRQKEYKATALNCKRSGDIANALQFLKVVKQFDVVIQMCVEGQEVDLSDMPPPPDQFLEFMAQMQAAGGASNAAESSAEAAPPASTDSIPAPPSEPVSSSSMLEALQQRLEKYKSVEESAKAEGNSSKARRFGRIVKQYEDAIKQYKAGRPVAYDELPVPPGFGPLPVGGNEAEAKPEASPPTVTPPQSNKTTPTSPAASPEAPRTHSAPQKHELTTRTSGNQQTNNLAEQQMKILLERQKEFKQAAIEAKKAGEIGQAKEYLKIFKGFDALLNAASSGLPVDLSTLPVPPSQRDNLEASFAIVHSEDCDPNDDISDIGVRIEEQLAKQLMMCKNTRDHHKAMGDVAGMNRFENLALTVQKDLDLVRYSKRKNFPLPKFHYEKKSFNIVHCNTDLTDSELEIVVVRGINYKVANPKDVDTYVKIEFPLLNDETFKAKTSIARDTDSPDYDQRFTVEIVRGNRQFQRIFKRHGVKFEVYSRGGFLRSDILIGTVNVKLQPLETKCEIHDTFDLMEGRKAIGGKLEIKLRLRNPMLTKQIEHINEKWLILDT